MSFSFKFNSNTTAGCANQHYFLSDGAPRVSRAYFKISAAGEYNYSLLFSGILDSSYRRISFHDEPCAGWKIHSAMVGKLHAFPSGADPKAIKDDEALRPIWLASLTFGGSAEKAVTPELFASDPVRLAFSEGEYLALELEYSGEKIPCLPEVAFPVYTKTPLGWEYSVNMPLPCMIGCDRPVKEMITYLGDSITQGADLPTNSYGHWVAKLAKMLPAHYSHWNLGIGLGKVSDVSGGGVWYQKALLGSTVFVCYGVNDINSDKPASLICSELHALVASLKSEGKRVILQAVPPFDYPEPRRVVWEQVNAYIMSELSSLADHTFNPGTVLSKSNDEPHLTRFGGHPCEDGCILWAEELYKSMSHLFP